MRFRCCRSRHAREVTSSTPGTIRRTPMFMSVEMEVGVDSFAAALTETSLAVSQADRMRDLLEEIEHADQVGLDVFGVGEHHRKEFLDSAPAVILAAAAARSKRIRLTSAVAVLSAAD